MLNKQKVRCIWILFVPFIGIIGYYIMKPHPIGTKIRFIFKFRDTGKLGTIVGIDGGDPMIYLPNGTRTFESDNGTLYTWICGWREIELVAQKGEQLQFSFMNE